MEQRLIDANNIYSKVQNSASDIDTEKDMKALFRYLLRTAQTVLTIPDNPTNGDMIKVLFPDGKICRTNGHEMGLRFKGDNWIIWFKESWWNAPYEKEAENDCY